MRWPWRKRNAPAKYPTLRAVASDKWLCEYRGQIRSGARTTYALYTSRISPAARLALLGEGFKGIAGKWPTHSIYCTHELFFDQGRTRLLFNIVLGFDSVARPAQDKAALQVTQILRRSLEQCKEPRFVIRKRTRLEFNWPQEAGELDEYWLVEATIAYRSVMRQMERLGLTVDGATEIQ